MYLQIKIEYFFMYLYLQAFSNKVLSSFMDLKKETKNLLLILHCFSLYFITMLMNEFILLYFLFIIF